jgi:hypothetical protein
MDLDPSSPTNAFDRQASIEPDSRAHCRTQRAAVNAAAIAKSRNRVAVERSCARRRP